VGDYQKLEIFAAYDDPPAPPPDQIISAEHPGFVGVPIMVTMTLKRTESGPGTKFFLPYHG
jgi:hypothetical protein